MHRGPQITKSGFTIRPVVALLLCAASVGVCAAARAEEKKAQPKTIKFELLKSMHMAVQVKVNGKGPYRLIFDTGAPTVLINNRLARDAGVINKDTKRPPIALFGTMGQFTLKSVEIGGVRIEDVPAVVADHPTVDALSQLVGPIDGIVGFPFFARFRTTIDYQAKEMTLVPVDYKPADIMQTMMATIMDRMNEPNKPKILVPAAQWGFSAEKSAGDDEAGVSIKEVLKGSAADKAGLKVGDRLLTLDGRWTDSLIDLFDAATYIKPGKTVLAKIRRDDKNVELKLTPTAGL